MTAKAILYDVTKANMLKVGTTLMLLNVIIKRDSKSVVMTNRSKLLKTSPFLESLPAHLIKEGLELACPPPAEVVSINKIKTSPVKTMVSIRGQVVSVSYFEFQYFLIFSMMSSLYTRYKFVCVYLKPLCMLMMSLLTSRKNYFYFFIKLFRFSSFLMFYKYMCVCV